MLSQTQNLPVDLGIDSQSTTTKQRSVDGSRQYELPFDALFSLSDAKLDSIESPVTGNELPLNGSALPSGENQFLPNPALATNVLARADQLELLPLGEDLEDQPQVTLALAHANLTTQPALSPPGSLDQDITETRNGGHLGDSLVATKRLVGEPIAPQTPGGPQSGERPNSSLGKNPDWVRITQNTGQSPDSYTELQQPDARFRLPAAPGLDLPTGQDFQRQLTPDVLTTSADGHDARQLDRQVASLSNTMNAGVQSFARESTLAGRTLAHVSTSIDHPVLDKAWGSALQDKVSWLTNRNIQSAEIRLNPAELGPIRVQVSVEDDAATLTFSAQHNVTRDAIEQALPRLREMLSDNGLTLAGSTVNDSTDGDEARREERTDERSAEAGEQSASANNEDSERQSVRVVDSSKIVDTFV